MINMLNDIFNFLKQHEAVLAVICAWIGREVTASKPAILWVWNSNIGMFGISKRFFFGVSQPKTNPVLVTNEAPKTVEETK